MCLPCDEYTPSPSERTKLSERKALREERKDPRFDVRPKVRSKRLSVLPENPEKREEESAVGLGRFPSWLHRRLPSGSALFKTGDVLKKNRLPTVCEEAKCPNLLECWSKKTATFLTMGKTCTRNCGFCSIDFSKTPSPLEEDEPERIADSVLSLGLKHVVLTQVARDDLSDGGASHLKKIVEEIRKQCPDTTIELLTSDFSGNTKAWEIAASIHPEVFNYNIETVRRLTPRVRHKATYERTLQFLNYLKETIGKRGTKIKSGLMLGLGETKEEVNETLHDLKQAGCDIVTLGQYLQPEENKLLVKAFIHPDTFLEFSQFGKSIGIQEVYSSPFVRSSYNADLVFSKLQGN